MTVKQLTKDIERCRKEAANYRKETDNAETEFWKNESIKRAEYYEKLVDKYIDMRYRAAIEEEEKMMKKIAKMQIKEKASTIGFIQQGNGDIKGITPSGRKWFGIHNWYGETERTKHCYTLRIEGKIMFTSGTIETVLETVAQN